MNLVPRFNFTTTTNSKIPKDEDSYIKLDIAHELWQSLKSISTSTKDILTSIRDKVKDYQQDYARYVAFENEADKNKVINDLKQQLEKGEITVDDVYDLAKRVGQEDIPKLMPLLTEYVNNQQLMNFINKTRNKEILEALKTERDKRIDEAINGFSRVVTPQLAGLGSDIPLKSVDYKGGEEYLRKLVGLGCEITTGEITRPGQSTTTSLIGVEDVITNWWKDWWKEVSGVVDIGVSFMPVIGDLYDAFTAVSGYSLSGKLTKTERILIMSTLLTGATVIPGVSGGTIKTGIKLFEENHHLLPKAFQNEFIRAEVTKEEIEKLKYVLPREVHRFKPDGLHTGENNWNKQWEVFFKGKEGQKLLKEDIFNQLETMVKAHKEQFTQQGIDEIMKKIDELRR